VQAEYYKEYYQLERTNWWFVARKKILRDQLLKMFPGRRHLRILNVGAALGASALMLQEFGSVVSVEYNRECCDFANRELGLGLIHGSITALPFKDNEFDLVCALDVVEQVQEEQMALSELAAFRWTSALFKRKKKNAPPRSNNSRLKDGFISKILYRIFKSETFFLKKGIRLPVGISLMVISEKYSNT
jgi:SAM-dependent methyltransferase